MAKGKILDTKSFGFPDKQLMRVVLDSASIGFWDWDIGSGKVSWSPTLIAMYGRDLGDFDETYQDTLRDIHPGDSRRVAGLVGEALRNGHYHAEHRIILPDKRIRWVEARGKVSYSADGQPVRMAGVCMDVTKRKLVDEAVRDSEERYRTIFEMSPAIIYELGLDGKFKTISPSFERITGWSPEEWIGRHFTKQIHPDDVARTATYFKRGVDKKRIIKAETRIRRKDGGYVTLSVESRPLMKDGVVIGKIGVARDVTHVKRKQYEEKVLARTVRQVNSAPDLNKTFPLFSKEIKKLIDYDQLHILIIDKKTYKNAYIAGNNIASLPLGTVRPLKNSLFEKILKTKKPAIYTLDYNYLKTLYPPEEFKKIEKGGKMSFILAPMFLQEHAVGGLVFKKIGENGFASQHIPIVEHVANAIAGTVSNMNLIKKQEETASRLEKAEAALKRYISQLRAVLQSVPDGIVVEDHTGHIIYANEHAANLLGYDSTVSFRRDNLKKVFGRFNITNTQGKKLTYSALSIAQVFKTGKESTVTLNFDCQKTGSKRWLKIKASPVVNGTVQTKLAVKVFEDISEEVDMQKQREIFFSLIGHEFKSPLASIRAFTQLLERRLREGKVKEGLNYLPNIVSQNDRLLKLINELLDTMRIRYDGLQLHKREVDYSLLVKKTVSELAPTTKIPIKVKVPPRIKTHLDEDRIVQLLDNLLMNAITYSKRNGKINVKVRKNGKFVETEVSDSGIGIPKIEQKNLFTIFGRAENAKIKNPVGTGMGLYICRAIAQSHKGDIFVKSRLNVGSTFTIKLPLANHD